MQRLKGESPYKVEILSTGLRDAEQTEAGIVVCVGWVVEDWQRRPFCYGKTDFVQGHELEHASTSYKLRATLSQKDIDEVLGVVLKAAHKEADKLKRSILRLMEQDEEAVAYARAN
jgi:hypothetical protein